MPDSLFSVEGQHVLVSGASRGIGRAIAQGFADRGAKVIVTGREAETVQKTANEIGNGTVGKVCDVADKKGIDRLVADVLGEFDRIDTLVNVAGVNRRKPSLDVSEEDFDFVLDINLRGAFFLSQAVGRSMVQQGSGSQINIGSLNNFRPVKNILPYAASKAGMGHMTESLAMEWGPEGVRVNCIAPGFILTDLTRQLWSRKVMQDWVHPNTPLRRLGKPEDMIGAAIFLASPASAFVTGQIIFVDGGVSAGIAWPIDQPDTD